MKRILGLMLLLLFSLSLFAQRLELTGGINRNSFFSWVKDDHHSSSEYTSDYGYNVKLAIDKLGGQFNFFRLSIGYETYRGKAKVKTGGLGGGSSIYIDTDKSVLSFGIYPFNFEFKKKVHLSLGGEFGWLLNQSYTGTYYSWLMSTSRYELSTYDFDNKDPRHKNYNKKTYFGLLGRIAYIFRLSDQWSLLPQYTMYWGWKDEFRGHLSGIKSFRQYASIGVRYQWNKL